MTKLQKIFFEDVFRGQSFRMYAKSPEKLLFLTPLYAHAHVRIRGYGMLVFLKNCVRTKLMIPCCSLQPHSEMYLAFLLLTC